MLANKPLNTARRIVKDTGSLGAFRWDDPTCLLGINEAIREIIKVFPYAHATTDLAYPLQPGVHQATPDGCVAVINLQRNSSGAPITPADRLILDVEDPGWQQGPTSLEVVHWYKDPMSIGFFEVYPPQPDPAGAVVIQYAIYPDEVDATTQELALDDRFEVAIAHYLVYYLLDEESNNPVNAEISMKHYEVFRGELMAIVTGTLPNAASNA